MHRNWKNTCALKLTKHLCIKIAQILMHRNCKNTYTSNCKNTYASKLQEYLCIKIAKILVHGNCKIVLVDEYGGVLSLTGGLY